MNKIVLSEIKDFTYNAINYNLKFTHRIYLSGDSGTGKTYLIQAIENYASLYHIPIMSYNFKQQFSDILNSIRPLKDTFIIFDNADIILTENLREYISEDFKNQYLIIGRNPDGLYVTSQTAKKLIFSNNTFSFAPLFET